MYGFQYGRLLNIKFFLPIDSVVLAVCKRMLFYRVVGCDGNGRSLVTTAVPFGGD